jgi:hypothetical protein
MTTEPGAIAVALNITCVLSVVLSFRPWRTRYPGLNLVGDLCRETVLRSAGLFVLSNTEHDDPPLRCWPSPPHHRQDPACPVAAAIKTGPEVEVKRLRHTSIDHATHVGGGQRVKAFAPKTVSSRRERRATTRQVCRICRATTPQSSDR